MTDILKRIQDLKQMKIELEKESAKLKADFKEYISDKSLPLAERWKIFAKSPDELKEHSNYIIRAKTRGLNYVLENWFDAPEVYGRGKRIETAYLFDNVFDSNLNYNPKYFSDEKVALCKEAMEDILSQNCGSFCYDW